VGALAERVRDGDRAAFAEMYDEYADPLYGFCCALLRDRDEAADAVHDAFLFAAQRIGQLRDLERLHSWLFAIARHVCFRKIEQRRRAAPTLVAPDDIVFDDDPAAALNAEEASALVWAAAAGLSDRDRAILYLNTREGLEGPELAAALGVVHANPYSLLNRAKTQLERAIGVLLVARAGRRDCATLATMLDGWAGALTPLLRKRIGRHVDSCVVCQRTRARVHALAGLAAIPVLRPTRADALVRRDYLDIAARTPVARERWRADGFPPPLDAPRRRRRRLLVLLVAVLAIGFGSLYEVTGAAGSGQPAGPATAVPQVRAHRAVKKLAQSRPMTSTTLLARSITAPTTAPSVRPAAVTPPPTTIVRAPPPTAPPTTVAQQHRSTPPTTRAPVKKKPVVAPPTTHPVAPPTTVATSTSLPGQ
jgi:RNA polymerase sigma factor (sigma-70 family)